MSSSSISEDVFCSFVRRWLSFAYQHDDLPGMSMAASFGPEQTFTFALGCADVERGCVLTANIPMHVASQSKLVVAIAAMQLVERGLLELHGRLPVFESFIPESLYDHVAELTLHDILVHRSGLPRDFPVNRTYSTFRDALEDAVLWEGLRSRPAYSNIAFDLLAHVVVAVAKEDLVAYTTKNIFEPAGMTATVWDPKSPVCQQYGPSLFGCRKLIPYESPQFLGAMGMWSTPEDLLALADVLAGRLPDVLSLDHARGMTATQWGPSPATGMREFGIAMEARWMAGRRWWGHTGGAPGFVSATYLCNETRRAFSVSLNGRDLRILENVIEALAAAIDFFDSAGYADMFHPFIGKYIGELGCTEIVANGDSVVLVDTSKWNPFGAMRRLRFEDSRTLRIDGNDFNVANARLAFSGDDADGAFTRLMYGPNIMHRAG